MIPLYLVSLLLFSVIDLLWVGVIAKDMYQEHIGFLMTDDIRWGAVLLFYGLYLFGLVFFVIEPALKERSVTMAIFSGALFGLICYATYDLTNLATLKGWPLTMVCYDLLWGAFASGLVSLITYEIGIFWFQSSR